MRDGVLSLRLPSGRELSYPAPSLAPGRFGKQQMMFTDMEAGRREGRHMYGGAWAENVTQAVARDLLVEGMKRLRVAGYKLVMHAHDEVCRGDADRTRQRGRVQAPARRSAGLGSGAADRGESVRVQ